VKKKDLIKLISKTLNVKENKLNNKSYLGCIPEWDSLGHLNIFFAIQKKLKKKIDLNKAAKAKNIDDWFKLIAKNNIK
tara:strand:- start:131 stop:364 length:234 start_codon:yes stop_codon:yes gene_type:complete